MSASDIFILDRPMAPRLIRILFALALILIALGVIAGVARGIAVMARVPQRPPVAATGTETPSAQGALTRPGPAANIRPFRGPRRFAGPFGLRRAPRTLFGIVLIVRALVMGWVAVMVVRILAEIGLAVLAMPRRSET